MSKFAIIPQKRPEQSNNFIEKQVRVLVLSFLITLLISLLIALFSRGIQNTNIGYTWNLIQREARWNDSWEPMSRAIDHLREFPDTPVYGDLFFNFGAKFQYPVSSLVFMDFLQRVTGLDWKQIYNFHNMTSWILVLFMGVIFYALWLKSNAFYNEKKDQISIISRFLILIIGFALVFSFFPIARSFRIGQIQTALTFLIGLALLAWLHQHHGLAGFFIGLCCVIKPQWGLIIIWAIFRREWKFVFVSLITVFIPLISSVFLYGINNYFEYLSVISFLGRHGESFYANQSVNGLMHRFLFNGNNLEWLNAFPPFHPLVYFSTLISSSLLLVFGLLWRRSTSPNIIDFSFMLLILTIASPIAWEHHYGFLNFVVPIILPMLLKQKIFSKWTSTYLWVAFFLVGTKLDLVTDKLAETRWNFLQSYHFFGAIMFLILFYKLNSNQNSTTGASEVSADIAVSPVKSSS